MGVEIPSYVVDAHTYNPEDLHVMERSVLRRSDIIPAFGRPVESEE